MSESRDQDTNLSAAIRELGPIPCGEEAAKHFLFDKGYINLNHGSYGSYPREVRDVYRHYQERFESRPDTFVRYELRTTLLDKSREAIADFLQVPVSTCVYVPNASTGIDIVLRNLIYEPGDVIIHFDTIYGAFGNTLQHLIETTPVVTRKILITLPTSDANICAALETAIEDLRSEGKNPKMAIFDTISSVPGLRMPFEGLTGICNRSGILSCIDGAHGIGQIPLHLQDLDPDFFVSNCHKWLHVPRGCAVLYVPPRNQHLITATVPTGFGFITRARAQLNTRNLTGEGKSAFVVNFEDFGTKDDSPYLCIPAALEWRKKVEWKGQTGEPAIMNYCHKLAREGGQVVATILGTDVFETGEELRCVCSLTNVRLPISIDDIVRTNATTAESIASSIMSRLNLKHNVAIYVFVYAGSLWVRLSAQVYLTLKEFEDAGHKIKETCDLSRRSIESMLKMNWC